jgi:soluble lytic murein transglycosylase-like protein
MASRNLCLLLIAAGLQLAAPISSMACQLHDPWLERFQVGQFRDPQRVELVEGWPADLLEPLSVDPGWREGAARFFAAETLPRDGDLTAWRLAIPALGGHEPAEARYREARQQWREIESLAAPAVAAPRTLTAAPGPWLAQVRQLQASRAWEQGDRDQAARLAAAIVAEAGPLGLGPNEILVWTLRAEALAAADPPAAPSERFWRAVCELGPYDTRSGWAVWSALQRERGLPVLGGDRADRDAAVMIATAGQLWLSPTEFRAAGFPPEVEAGLGGLLLPVEELTAHFRRWPEPPTDGRFQGYWLRGQRRLRGGAAAIAELAALPGLVPGHRLDLWRRASEARLLQGHWAPGLQDLAAGLELMASEASSAMKDRLRVWVVQALALALAQERSGDAQRILALADRFLVGEQAAAFAQDAAPLLARLGRSVPPASRDLRDGSEALVLRGEAPPIAAVAPTELPDPVRWRHGLWEHWARWGLALLGADLSLPPRQQEYRLGLVAILATDDPAQRHTTAVAVAGGGLRGTPAVDPLVTWAITRDIERCAAGLALPLPSPLPQIRAPGSRPARERQLQDHALMGAAVALGDDRGVLAMAVRLPAAAAPAAWRWPFWYPLPADPTVRAALAEAAMPSDLLLAIARNESLFDPGVRSRAGALGYMQIMPFHYQDPAGRSGPDHWRHPTTSLRAGSRILADAVRRHRGDPYRSVAAYNAGSTAVDRWQQQLGAAADNALYRAWIGYPETRGYTLRVLRDREVYRALIAGAP